MVDSRAKGARNELALRDKLRDDTGLQWERTPSSGALSANHGLKGDLYIPNAKNNFAVEVKAYKEDHITSAILSSKESILHKWWKQAERQARETDKKPLLFCKKDRGKWFVCFRAVPAFGYDWILVSNGRFYIAMYDHWIRNQEVEWTS